MLENDKKILVTLIAVILVIPLATIFGQHSSKRIGNPVKGRLNQIGPAVDHNSVMPDHQLNPLQPLLNVDGALDLHRDFSGSLDARGWKMIATGSREPRFVSETGMQKQSPQTEPGILADHMDWDNRFAKPGVDSTTTFPTVWAVTVSGSDVYVGGKFNTAGGATANNIAKWDGVSWSALGDGVNAAVGAIFVNGSDVYAAGPFTSASGVDASGIAKWNGNSWSALGSGLRRLCPGCRPGVSSLAMKGNDLYVAGVFDMAGGITVNNIAKWDGAKWSALGSGYTGPGVVQVAAMATIGGDLYAGGTLGVSKWDGASWSVVGSELSGSVGDLAVIGTDIYACGLLILRGNLNPTYVAKWDGAKWSALGSDVNSEVFALAAVGTDLYAGGQFTSAGGSSARFIAKWNGTSWSPLAEGVRSDIDDRIVDVFALATNGSDLYVGGDFILAGGLSANMVAKWNGAAWSVLGDGPGGAVESIVANGNDIYAGGVFNAAGGTRASKIARWDGAKWSALGNGVGRIEEVHAMALSGGMLYAGGQFSTAGEVNANNIALWNGDKWSALGSGLSGCNGANCAPSVKAIAVKGTDVYAGGTFTTAGGVPANGIAKWDGTSWSALGSGIDGEVKALAFVGSDLYVGGFFNAAGGVAASKIARWNGTNWSAVGSGADNIVYALAVSGNNLYVGGAFKKAGGLVANNIAGWNGSSWFVLGSGIDSTVLALAAGGGSLYAGGIFATAGGTSAKDIARWNGSEWHALGGGVSFGGNLGSVSAIAIAGSDVYVGGVFNLAGDKVSYCFARWFAPTVQAQVPKITSASVRGKKLFVLGENFDDGAAILLNGEAQKTLNDGDIPSSRLIGKKAGKKIKSGDKLQVQNSNGLLSAEFTFTGQ